MPTAVVFALLRLGFAGLNDVVFKRYAAKERSRGALVCGIGLVWLTLQALWLLGQGRAPQTDGTTLGFGLLAGAFLAASNILLIEGLAHVELSLGSTIYRLNTLGVAVLAVVFLSESLGAAKLAGLAVGVLAVLLLVRRPLGLAAVVPAPPLYGLFVALVALASLLRAAYGVLSKAALSGGADAATLVLIAAACWVVAGGLYALWRDGRLRFTRTKAAYAAVSGLLVFLIVNCLIAAVARGEASVVIPIANLSFIAAMLLTVALGMERLSRRKVAAMACAVLAIGLLSRA